MGRWCLWVALVAAPMPAIAQTAVHAPEAPMRHVTHATLVTIVRALAKGDVPRLARLYKQPPDLATRVLAAMALERIHFHLDKATADARVCERSLAASQPRIALFCAEFANGNIRLAHGERAADADELDMARRLMGKVPAAALDTLRRYVAGRQGRPTMQMHRPDGTFVIPLGTLPHSDMQTITVHANGNSLPLIVDTGTGYIDVDAYWANKLGVHFTDRSSTTRGILAHGIHIRHGVIDKLSFSGVTLEHVPVEVVPGKQRLIGIQVLRRLGAFRLARGKLTAYANGERLQSCRQPMLIASDPWGQQLKLLTAVWVNDALYTPPVDSGTSGFLYATKAAMKTLKSGGSTRLVLHDMGPRKHHTRTNWATAMVRIAGQRFQLTLPIFEDAKLRWDFLLGTGALKYMDFYFDFIGHHTCMLMHDHMP